MNGKATAIAALVGLGLLVWWLTKAPFKVGDRVQDKANPSIKGTVIRVYKAGPDNEWSLDITFDDGVTLIGVLAKNYQLIP
mgnify:CR=1 FL=1